LRPGVPLTGMGLLSPLVLPAMSAGLVLSVPW
jgi:hypothetical protein